VSNSKRKCPNSKSETCRKYNRPKDGREINNRLYCGDDCITEYALKNRLQGKKKLERHRKQEHARKKREFYDKDIKTRREAAQMAFNKYIKARDKGLPCVSCDKPDNGLHQRHSSHYRSIGACSALRFHEDNCHASCQQCNTEKSGNLIEYRRRLVKRIGLEKVEWLEFQNGVTRYKADDLKSIEIKYKNKVKELL